MQFFRGHGVVQVTEAAKITLVHVDVATGFSLFKRALVQRSHLLQKLLLETFDVRTKAVWVQPGVDSGLLQSFAELVNSSLMTHLSGDHATLLSTPLQAILRCFATFSLKRNNCSILFW